MACPLASATAFQPAAASTKSVAHRRRCQLVACTAAARPDAAAGATSRRQQLAAFLAATAAAGMALVPAPAQAIGFKKELKKKKIPLEDYPGSGLRIYDLAVGSGPEVQACSKVTLHFDCLYKGIDVVSSRSARLLSGNRTLAEPFEFIAGRELGTNAARKVSDGAGGLFTGLGGPKPPPALSVAVIGMRPGGKRSVIVPPELGYGAQGEQEIPPNAESFELQVEVLAVAATAPGAAP